MNINQLKICGFLLLALGFNSAFAQTLPSSTELAVVLTREQQALCTSGGGCLLMTQEQLVEALEKIFRKGQENGFDKGERTCMRPA